jgi:hypothetical protein
MSLAPQFGRSFHHPQCGLCSRLAGVRQGILSFRSYWETAYCINPRYCHRRTCNFVVSFRCILAQKGSVRYYGPETRFHTFGERIANQRARPDMPLQLKRGWISRVLILVVKTTQVKLVAIACVRHVVLSGVSLNRLTEIKGITSNLTITWQTMPFPPTRHILSSISDLSGLTYLAYSRKD